MTRTAVLRLNEERVEYTMTKQLPKDMRDEVYKRVGSEFDKSQGLTSKAIIRGLNEDQEKVYLPNLIGISATNQEFPKRAMDFWADYTITPTKKGLLLNISTEEKEVSMPDGSKKIIDVPVNIDDYMMYMFAKQSSKVASNPDDLDNAGHFDFILEDLTKVRERELSEFEARDSATLIYARLTSKFESNMTKIDWILEMTKEDTFYDPDIDMIDKKIALRKLTDDRPGELIKLSDDVDLELKAFLSSLLSHSIITLEGNDYFYLNERMGSEEKGGLAYIKRVDKSGAVAAMKSKLSQAIQDRKRTTINK